MDNSAGGVHELGELLVKYVRDVAIRSCDRQLDPGSQTPIAARWRRVPQEETSEAVRIAIPDCVDEAIASLLVAIDQGLIEISFRDLSGALLDLSEAGHGELAGWYMGSDGWRSRFSNERYVDDFDNVQ